MKQLLYTAVFCAIFQLFPVSAPRADDAVILTIDGKVAASQSVDFTREQLEAMPMSTIVTTTPWHDGATTFEGVPLSVLMERVGAKGERAVVFALNNYSVDIPVEEFDAYGPILALKRNGQYMPISDKGPLFVIYPFDQRPELKNELHYTRSVWQVRSISIE
ncbi:molybdopterin-dependent oxidoreductase [Stappia sp. F7233]|uniref:Molybdopterin-dependent oxidoreductase n=1 Tax=Stappia albiluteola TaxID=2758565 RepID=A0A839AHR7_9HYPH|nr:molybdopterin-dependent oxidoreductase [Stappia albiluteola]MBA5779253.1 molybdopterin-dependent oxidoreductase [Stappia albiluteola]